MKRKIGDIPAMFFPCWKPEGTGWNPSIAHWDRHPIITSVQMTGVTLPLHLLQGVPSQCEISDVGGVSVGQPWVYMIFVVIYDNLW